MTKEELLLKTREGFSGYKYLFLSDVNEFFESNVYISKGKSRHPYADVLHKWLEGAEIEVQSLFGYKHTSVLQSWKVLEGHYRIKPPEPVPEYQYSIFYAGTKYISEDYKTEEEISWLSESVCAEPIKQTKRERIQ
jgi:hypothetical protein